MSKLKTFILESIDEVRYRVVWPAYREIQSSAMLVLTASLVFSVVIGIMDLVFKNAFSWLYGTF